MCFPSHLFTIMDTSHFNPNSAPSYLGARLLVHSNDAWWCHPIKAWPSLSTLLRPSWYRRLLLYGSCVPSRRNNRSYPQSPCRNNDWGRASGICGKYLSAADTPCRHACWIVAKRQTPIGCHWLYMPQPTVPSNATLANRTDNSPFDARKLSTYKLLMGTDMLSIAITQGVARRAIVGRQCAWLWCIPQQDSMLLKIGYRHLPFLTFIRRRVEVRTQIRHSRGFL